MSLATSHGGAYTNDWAVGHIDHGWLLAALGTSRAMARIGAIVVEGDASLCMHVFLVNTHSCVS